MKMRKTIIAFTLALFVACGASAQQRLLGGDISLLPSYMEQGTQYKDASGNMIDNPIGWLRDQTWNCMRVRLFVDPANASGAHKGEGVCQDLAYVKALSRDIRKAGMKLMLDFHYSDTWADPGKQFTPRRWEGVPPVALADTIYRYTRSVLREMVKNGTTPDLIQIGNEITNGMLWPTAKVSPTGTENWDVLTSLLRNASRACREVCPGAGIIVHTEKAYDMEATRSYYNKLAEGGVDYDIIGLSYYPMWHESVANLGRNLDTLAVEFPAKPVMIVETAFYYSHKNDRWAKSDDEFADWYPISPEGQRRFTRELVDELKRHKNVTGLFWWFPEENACGNNVIESWINRGLFDNVTGKALPAIEELKRFR